MTDLVQAPAIVWMNWEDLEGEGRGRRRRGRGKGRGRKGKKGGVRRRGENRYDWRINRKNRGRVLHSWMILIVQCSYYEQALQYTW